MWAKLRLKPSRAYPSLVRRRTFILVVGIAGSASKEFKPFSCFPQQSKQSLTESLRLTMTAGRRVNGLTRIRYRRSRVHQKLSRVVRLNSMAFRLHILSGTIKSFQQTRYPRHLSVKYYYVDVSGIDELLPDFRNSACRTTAGSCFYLYLQTANRILRRYIHAGATSRR